MKDLNEYFRDAGTLLRAGLRQRTNVGPESAMVATLLYALGVERVLKGILHDVNPVYVYKEPAFKHTVTAIYPDRIVGTAKSSQEIAKEPNHEVLTFREALRRAAVFSTTIQANLATLHRIANARDVIAHCRLSQLAQDEAFRLAFLDLPHVIGAFEVDLGLQVGTLEGRLEDDPAEVKAREDAGATLRARLREHARRWEALKQDPLHCTQAAKRLEILRQLAARDRFYIEFPCPACANMAALQGEVDYDYVDHESVPQGVFPVRLECAFCDLIVEDSYELDELKASEYLYDREVGLRES